MDSRPWPGSISARLRSTLIDRTLSLKNPAPPPTARSWRAASLPPLPGCPLSLLPSQKIPRPAPPSPAASTRPHRLMHAVLAGQLRGRQLTPQRLYRNLGLELSRITLPLAHHGSVLHRANQA